MNADAPAKGYDLAGPDRDYPAWDGPPARSVVICTHQRSGSTLLGEAITFAGGMGIPLEYFHRGFRPALAARWGSIGTSGYVAALHRHRTDPSGILAVKLFWQDVADLAAEQDPACEALRAIAPGEPAVDLYRRARAVLDGVLPNAVWISLERRDAVRQAVSLERAAQTDVWRDIGARDISGAPTPSYRFEALAARLHWIRRARSRWRSFFAANGIVPHEICYEEMVRDPAGTLEGLCRLMGRDCPPLPAARTRRQADSLSEEWTKRLLRDLHREERFFSGTGT